MSDFVNTVELIGDEVLVSSIIDRSIKEIADNIATRIGANALRDCLALTTATFLEATIVGGSSFNNCKALTTVKLPAATEIESYVFNECRALVTIDLGPVTSIKNQAFYNCMKLTALIIRSGTVGTLSATNAFNNTPIKNGTGYIYVPRALLSDDDATKDYRRATNWSTFANQFRALEDYTVDGTTTGELDPTKIAA